MTYLKKLGMIALKGFEIASGFGPIIGTAFPQAAGPIQIVQKDLEILASIIASVEAMGQAISLPGAQKLVAATPLVAQAILQSSLLVGKKIADPALFQRGAQKIGDGMADVLNSLHEDSVTTEKKT